jgi:hypothetical protein
MNAGRWSTMCVVMLTTASLSACNPAQKAKEAHEEVESGNAAACVAERSNIQSAVEAYTLLNPDVPVSESAMVAAGFIHTESALMDISATGVVSPTPGGPCA